MNSNRAKHNEMHTRLTRCLCSCCCFFRLIFIHFFCTKHSFAVQSDGHDFSTNSIQSKPKYCLFHTCSSLNVQQHSRVFFLRFSLQFLFSVVLQIAFFSILSFSRSLVHGTKYTTNNSKENQCERAIDIIKTMKRKQTTNFLCVYHMGAEVDT